MMIEIKGIGLPNRGAELMLLAIQQQFEQRGVMAKFVAEPQGDYSTRARYGLYQKSRFFARGYNFGWPLSLLPGSVRRRFGIVNRSEIDLVIDASGFAYGDKWGKKLIYDRLGAEIDYFKKRGVKVILLPQAFGSFDNQEVSVLCKSIFQKVDILIARDRASIKYIKELGISNAKLYPDFTNLVQPVDVPLYESLAGRACVIPNFQMIKRGGAGNGYKHVLSSSISLLRSLGKNPYILIHEGIKDLELAQEVNKMLSEPAVIVDPKDALTIKSIISNACLVVSSRFHGLVSALSCGVPVVAMGWSHKYQMLLEDYDVPELLVEVDVGQISSMIEKIAKNNEYRNTLVSKIKTASIVQKDYAAGMWDEVFYYLENGRKGISSLAPRVSTA